MILEIKEIPEIKIVYIEVDKIISKGFEDPRWPFSSQEIESRNITVISKNSSEYKPTALSSVSAKELKNLARQATIIHYP